MPVIHKVDYSPLEGIKEPYTAQLTLEQLKINPDAQRELLPNKLNNMVERYSPAGVGELLVSKRGGSYYVFDGQHRMAMLERADPELKTLGGKVSVRVYEGLTLEQEALLFLIHNEQSTVTTAASFNVMVTAGVGHAVKLKEILNKYGIPVGTNNRQFAAVGAATRISKWMDGYATFDRVIEILALAWPDPIGKNRPYREEIVSGLARMVHRYGDQLDTKRLAKYLQDAYSIEQASDQILAAATAARMITHKSLHTNVAYVLVNLYNTKSRGTGKLPDWNPSDPSPTVATGAVDE